MHVTQDHEAMYSSFPSSHTPAFMGTRICMKMRLYHIKPHKAMLMCLKHVSVSFPESDAQTISSFVYWSGNETRCSHTNPCIGECEEKAI